MSETEKPRDWAEMTVKQLRACCAEQGLTQVGTKKELVKRLAVQKFGRSDKFVHGYTKCDKCGAQAKVSGTIRVFDAKTRSFTTARYWYCRANRKHHGKL